MSGTRRLERKPKPQTVLSIGISCTFASLLKSLEWKWIYYRPAKINRLKEDSGRIVYLTASQASKLLEKAGEHQSPFIYTFIMIALETSLRGTEFLSIQLEYVDLQRRIIYIPHAKGRAREQPITKNLANYLKDYLKTTEPEQVWAFPSTRSKCGHIKWPEHAFRKL